MKKLLLFLLLFVATINLNAQTKLTAADSLKFETVKKQLHTFFIVINKAGMDSLFTGKPVTILAPDDQAFSKLPAGKLDTLLNLANKAALIEMVNSHIIAGRLSSKGIAKSLHDTDGKTVLTTLSGNKLTAKVNANRNIVFIDDSGNESIVKQFDITDKNTVIFVISSVILPIK